jgi:hypothetical protein
MRNWRGVVSVDDEGSEDEAEEEGEEGIWKREGLSRTR